MGVLSRASARLFYELLRRATAKGRVNLKSEIVLPRCGTYTEAMRIVSCTENVWLGTKTQRHCSCFLTFYMHTSMFLYFTFPKNTSKVKMGNKCIITKALRLVGRG